MTHWQDTHTETVAAEARALEDASPDTILQHAVDHFGDRLAIVTSFQATGIVTLHMMRQIYPDVPVFTLDTGLLFPETYDLINEVEARFNLNLRRVRPAQSLVAQAVNHSPELWRDNPNACCHLRKVVPLHDVLTDADAWVSGIRRDQSPTRANTPVIMWDTRNQKVKYAPFATWTEEMIWTYIHAYDLPYNRLYEQGYSSIGCLPCTGPAANGTDMRSGRWQGHTKTECGIHLSPERA